MWVDVDMDGHGGRVLNQTLMPEQTIPDTLMRLNKTWKTGLSDSIYGGTATDASKSFSVAPKHGGAVWHSHKTM